jgi:hypothetical protein
MRISMTTIVPILVALAIGCRPIARAPGSGDFTQQDVQAFITPGMPFEQITNRFGQPFLTKTQGEYLVTEFRSGLPDTTLAKRFETNGYVFSSFRLFTKDGKAVRWMPSGFSKRKP